MHPPTRRSQPNPTLLGWTTNDDGKHRVTVPNDPEPVVTPDNAGAGKAQRRPGLTTRTMKATTPPPPPSTSSPKR